MLSRASGVLLPVFSLPSHFGIGDMGPGAFRFVDFLHAAGQRVWQVLPITPTEPAFGHSPYHSISCFAGNPLLISPEILKADGLLDHSELKTPVRFPSERIDYPAAVSFKRQLLEKACLRFQQNMPDGDFKRFCADNAFWIDDYALFCVLSNAHARQEWNRWPMPIRRRNPDDIARFSEIHHASIERLKIEQYLFYRQWDRLRTYCREKRVHLFGDLPIYVPLHSADVWAHRRFFSLDRWLRPCFVSGVPPDYFSADGQLWGHPVYNWNTLQQSRFDWWIQRIAHQMAVFDAVRIDHFRGLVGYWQVPAESATAKTGHWEPAPAEDFFTEIQRRFVSLPLIAEDLGEITADVREIMQRFGLPGMRVLMFGFSGDSANNPHAVQNIPEQCVLYTGTHDNNTARGWLETEASPDEKRRFSMVSGQTARSGKIAGELIRLAMMSCARWSIFPVQDVLGLDASARMNTPGTTDGNWQWRLTDRQFDALPAKHLRELTRTFGRL